MTGEPVRMCVYCRARLSKADMQRFVIQDGIIIKDEKGTLPGRGAYCCRNADCVSKAAGDWKGIMRMALNAGRKA